MILISLDHNYVNHVIIMCFKCIEVLYIHQRAADTYGVTKTLDNYI